MEARARREGWVIHWESCGGWSVASCRKLQTAPSMEHWQQACTPKAWTHHFPTGPLDCTFLGSDYGGFYVPNRMCWLHENPEPPNRSYVAYGFGIGTDLSYDVSSPYARTRSPAHAYSHAHRPARADWSRAARLTAHPSVTCARWSAQIALAAAYPNLIVRMFDPTPYALRHAHHVVAALTRRETPCDMGLSPAACRGSYFRAIAHSAVSPSRLSVHPWAIGTEDGVLGFHKTRTGSLYSHKSTDATDAAVTSSAGNAAAGTEAAAANSAAATSAAGGVQLLQVRTLQSIMSSLGDEVVDVLKVDVEGAEVEVLPALLHMWRMWPRARWPKLLLIDMDSMRANHPRRNVSAANAVVELLVEAGYLLFAHPKKPDYSFVLPLTQREMYYGEREYRPPPPPPRPRTHARAATRRDQSAPRITM